MESLFKRGILAGLGLMDVTKERIEDFVDELVKRGEMSKDERAGFVRDVTEKIDQRSQQMKDWIEMQVDEKMEKIRPKTQKKIDEMNNKIARMQAEIESLSEQLDELKKESVKPSESDET